MAISKREHRVVEQIIQAHGPTLDLSSRPEVLIEIIRKWGFDLLDEIPDAGVRPGGVGPTSLEAGPRLEDVLKEILTLQRQVDKINRRLDG